MRQLTPQSRRPAGKATFGGKLLACIVTLQREGQVIHVIAKTAIFYLRKIKIRQDR